jgi:prepilin-type N-terminal cleavage/methylation domain-containing protein
MNRRNDRLAGDGGFTLVELLTVILILGVLTAVAVSVYVTTADRAATVSCRYNQRLLEKAAIGYQFSNSGDRPASMEDLREFARDFDNATHCPSDDTPLVLDTVTLDVTCPNHP